MRAYDASVRLLTDWAKRQDIRDVEQLTPAHLAHFRDSLISRRVTRATKGGKRGARDARSQPIRPASVNHHLRAVSAFLNVSRKHGLTPRLSRDLIAESLACLPLPRPQPVAFKPAELCGILRAALRHDAETWDETREEHAGERPKGTTPRYRPIAPLVVFTMLTGCRIGEPLALEWSDVDLDAPDHEGNPVGEIQLDATATKTHTARRVTLEVSPRLRTLLKTLRLQAGEAPFVFGGAEALDHYEADNARDRLIREFGAPSFTWQRLRQTCGSYLTNAPGIYGAASAYRSAKQLGHSVQIAERHYLDVVRGISREARTLDDAMQIAGALDAIIAVLRREASPVFLSKVAG
jgi:integrase